jgi:hypothetical protein
MFNFPVVSALMMLSFLVSISQVHSQTLSANTWTHYISHHDGYDTKSLGVLSSDFMGDSQFQVNFDGQEWSIDIFRGDTYNRFGKDEFSMVSASIVVVQGNETWNFNFDFVKVKTSTEFYYSVTIDPLGGDMRLISAFKKGSYFRVTIPNESFDQRFTLSGSSKAFLAVGL